MRCADPLLLRAVNGLPQPEGKEEGGKSLVKKGPTWMYNKEGVAFAPWMVDTFDPEVRLHSSAAR
jgi:hypothetical protein